MKRINPDRYEHWVIGENTGSKYLRGNCLGVLPSTSRKPICLGLFGVCLTAPTQSCHRETQILTQVRPRGKITPPECPSAPHPCLVNRLIMNVRGVKPAISGALKGSGWLPSLWVEDPFPVLIPVIRGYILGDASGEEAAVRNVSCFL